MSKIIPNPLNIAESELLRRHNQVVNCFAQNNIPFEANYLKESDPAFNSIVLYTISLPDKKVGFIGCPNGKFLGTVIKDEKFKYLLSEGFEESSFDEKMFSGLAPSVMHFVCMLAFERMKELSFSLELIGDFDSVSEKDKAKKRKAKSEK